MLKFTVVKIAIVPTVITLQLIFKTLNTVCPHYLKIMKDAFYDSEFSKFFRGADDPLPSNRPTPYSNQPRKPNPTLYSNYAPRSVPHTFLLSNLSLCSGKVMPNLFLQTIT